MSPRAAVRRPSRSGRRAVRRRCGPRGAPWRPPTRSTRAVAATPCAWTSRCSDSDHRDELRQGNMAAPVPMPITGVDYRLINLMATVPHRGLPRAVRRLAQGMGGKLLGREYLAGGQALAAGLYDAVLRAGIPVWRNTALRALVTEDGATGRRIRGADVVRDGEPLTIEADKGVLLSAGGFDHDMARRRAHQLSSLDEWSL